MTCSQSVVLPLAGLGRALAFGNVNNAPMIASAKKPLRSCCLNFGLFMFFEFSFRCFGLHWLLIIKKPFLAFTDVLRKILRSLTRKVLIFYRRKRRERSLLPRLVAYCCWRLVSSRDRETFGVRTRPRVTFLFLVE